jgi:hypothetical protein
VSFNHPYLYFNNSNNRVQYSPTQVYLLSSTSAGHSGEVKGMGLYVYCYNIRQAVSLFTSRALTKKTWVNDADTYLSPKDNK